LSMKLDQHQVIDFFNEAAARRPLIPDVNTVSGWGKFMKYQAAAEFTGRSGAKMVLDLGCNIGHLAHFIARQNQNGRQPPFIAGIDLSLASLQQARQEALPNCGYSAANGCRLPFPDRCFDLVLCLDVLEHVTDKSALLREIRRVLKPEGILYLITPNPNCLGSYLSFKLYRILRAGSGRPEVNKDSFVNQKELIALLGEADFNLREIKQSYFLTRPFIRLKGWILTPPLPPRWGVSYQKFWNRILDVQDQHVPMRIRDRVGHSLTAVVKR